jgi:hypothetical protein
VQKLASLLVFVASVVPWSNALGEENEFSKQGLIALEIGFGSVVREKATSSSSTYGLQLGQKYGTPLGLVGRWIAQNAV